MILKISNKEQLLNNFLIPLSKITDSIVLNVDKGKITSLISTQDNTVIVDSSFDIPGNESVKKLNIPDIKKLCRILQCIDEQEIQLKLDINNVSYSSNDVRFKYHLYDDSIISVPKLNLAKLEQLDFDGKFTLKHPTMLSLIKGSTIATDTNKIYVSFKEKSVYGELTDKARANVDSYGLLIADDYEGVYAKDSIPLNFEIFRIISSMRFKELNAQLITKMGVVTMDLNLDSSNFKFVISALSN